LRKNNLLISVIIPTHNPRREYLNRVIQALVGQTLDRSKWEVVVVDNKSEDIGYSISDIVRDRLGKAESGKRKAEKTPSAILDLPSTPSARVVREDKLGLTHARVRGFQEAKGEIMVMVDDDNVLKPDYLERAIKILKKNPQLGAIGGKALPEFEIEPPEWLKGRSSGLGLRDLGDSKIVYPDERRPLVEGGRGQAGRKIKVTEFPECAPIGAGMVIRREAALEYVEALKRRDTVVTDRKGKSLASGGDNDICLTALEHGWGVGYFPELELTHLIPKERMTLEYQNRMARDSMRSFVVMLDQHGIQPWAPIASWTVPLRVARAWWRDKPWKGEQRILRFANSSGQFLGRADIWR
jgi:glycosyltransferase involved in cell wall biosynthesis